MIEKLPISCFIIALNEADRIEKTIKSVKDLVDEIIVIDSGSTDGTQKLAEDMGCKVFYNKWNGFGPQKRFGEDCSKNKWLLNLDADEYLSDEISDEIRNLFKNNHKDNFYSMRVIPIYPNWKKPRLFSAYHLCIRLYNIDYGRFSNSKVHDSVETNLQKVTALKKPVFHKSVRSFNHLIIKIFFRSLLLFCIFSIWAKPNRDRTYHHSNGILPGAEGNVTMFHQPLRRSTVPFDEDTNLQILPLSCPS